MNFLRSQSQKAPSSKASFNSSNTNYGLRVLRSNRPAPVRPSYLRCSTLKKLGGRISFLVSNNSPRNRCTNRWNRKERAGFWTVAISRSWALLWIKPIPRCSGRGPVRWDQKGVRLFFDFRRSSARGPMKGLRWVVTSRFVFLGGSVTTRCVRLLVARGCSIALVAGRELAGKANELACCGRAIALTLAIVGSKVRKFCGVSRAATAGKRFAPVGAAVSPIKATTRSLWATGNKLCLSRVSAHSQVTKTAS
jgi:hypothetical protein